MNRRAFLKVGGLLSATLFLQFNALANAVSLPIEARSGDSLYRGTNDGRIFVSADAGENWQLHTNFGPAFSISALSSSVSGQIYAQLEFAGHSFELVLAQDSKIWRTA